MIVMDGPIEALETEDALADDGFVLMMGTAVGKVKKAAGAASDIIVGFNFTNTKNLAGTAVADVKVGVVKPKPGIVARLKLEGNAGRTTAIIYGSKLVASGTTAGTVLHATDNANGKQVGFAREACAANADTTDGKIEVEIQFAN